MLALRTWDSLAIALGDASFDMRVISKFSPIIPTGMRRSTPSLSSLRFRCTGCGGCCRGRGDYWVEASRAEQRRIQRFLDVSWDWFRRRYVTAYEDGTEGLRWQGDRCVFLDAHGRCRIYAVRPTQCQTYPFWPEVVGSRASWRAAANECEGIGRGAVIPLARVQARLREYRRKTTQDT